MSSGPKQDSEDAEAHVESNGCQRTGIRPGGQGNLVVQYTVRETAAVGLFVVHTHNPGRGPKQINLVEDRLTSLRVGMVGFLFISGHFRYAFGDQCHRKADHTDIMKQSAGFDNQVVLYV